MVTNLLKNFEFTKFDEVTSNSKSRRFRAFGTVELLDRHNEILPIEEFIKSLDDWMSNGGTILDNHRGAPVGKALRWKEVLKNGLPAIELVIEVFKTRLGDKVWKAMKSGKKEGLSVGGSILTKEDSEKGSQILRGLQIDEFSIVDRTGNQGATISGMSLAKSEDTVISTEDDEVKTDEDSKEDSEEETTEDKVDNAKITALEEEVRNLKADINNQKKMVEEIISTVTGTPANDSKDDVVEKTEAVVEKTEEVKAEEVVEKSANDLILEKLESISKRLETLEKTEEPKEEEVVEEKVEEVAKAEEVVEVVETPAPVSKSEVEDKKTYSEIYKSMSEGKISQDEAMKELRNI